MNEARQILCIVNSRKHAQEVFGALKGEGCYHLSTLMTPADRREKLAEIRRRLMNKEPCRVVSTSLIEAGVDVDFPAVMREEAGLDSVLQAAGRCNREGKRDSESSVVTVFQPETPPPALFRMNIAAAQTALRVSGGRYDSAAVTRYFEELLSLAGNEALDRYGVINMIKTGTSPFRKIAERFHLIDSPTVTVYIPTAGEGEALLERRLHGGTGRSLMRQLGQYGVNLYPQHFQALQAVGAVAPLGENEWYLRDMSLYDLDTGLSLEADSGKAEFI